MDKKDDLQMNELQGEITEKSPLKNDTDVNDGFDNKKNGKEKKDENRKIRSESSSSSCLSSLKAKLLVIIIVALIASSLIVAYLYFLHNNYNKMEDSEIVEYLTTIPSLSMNDKHKNLLYYLSTKDVNNSNWINYTNEITTFLSNYNINITKEVNSSYTVCDNQIQPPDDKLCVQNITDIESLCNKDDHYGYPDGKPCILIKFHPYTNFTVESYNETELIDNGLNGTNYRVNQTYLYLHCEGVNGYDKEKIGIIQYAPVTQEYAKHYFNNVDDEKYIPPVIAIKLNSIQKGVLASISCSLMARNLIYENGKSPFQVQFDVLID